MSLPIPRRLRRGLAHIRPTSHNLEVEMGRHNNVLFEERLYRLHLSSVTCIVVNCFTRSNRCPIAGFCARPGVQDVRNHYPCTFEGFGFRYLDAR